MAVAVADPLPADRPRTGDAAIHVHELRRRFGDHEALRGVSLSVQEGEVHALLGPNGAGKTTLLRVLTGLATPSSGNVKVAGLDASTRADALKEYIGWVPSGDRSFYLRLSGPENLRFFARLRGLRTAEAKARSAELLEQVGLGDVGKKPVGRYSHGMQKRLSIARSLLVDPHVLLVDEATHDLDPPGAEHIRAIIGGLAARGTAVLWATQRVDEIRGFADRVTFLAEGQVRFSGSVERLLAYGQAGRYLLRLRLPAGVTVAALDQGLADRARLEVTAETEHAVLETRPGTSLGDAVAWLADRGVDVLDCVRERSEAEAAFFALLAEEGG